eukprot:353408-Chlamydomonas_euryale.AAC.12
MLIVDPGVNHAHGGISAACAVVNLPRLRRMDEPHCTFYEGPQAIIGYCAVLPCIAGCSTTITCNHTCGETAGSLCRETEANNLIFRCTAAPSRAWVMPGTRQKLLVRGHVGYRAKMVNHGSC